MNELETNETSRKLRILAKQLDEGVDVPDFCFCMIEGDKFTSTHRSNVDIFGLIGLINYRLFVINSEVDHY